MVTPTKREKAYKMIVVKIQERHGLKGAFLFVRSRVADLGASPGQPWGWWC